MEDLPPVEEFLEFTRISYIPESELRTTKEPLKSARVPLSSGIDISKQIRDKVQSVIEKNVYRKQLTNRRAENATLEYD